MKTEAKKDAIDRVMSDIESGQIELPPGQSYENIKDTLKEISKEVMEQANDPFEARQMMLDSIAEVGARAEKKAVEEAETKKEQGEWESAHEVDADKSAAEALAEAKKYKGVAEEQADGEEQQAAK